MESIVGEIDQPIGHNARCAQDVLNEVRRLLVHVRAGGEFEPSFVDRIENMHTCHLAIALWYAATYADMARVTPDEVVLTALEYEVWDTTADSP